MKKLAHITLLLVMAFACMAQTETRSSIKSVQVYLQGAEIYRSAQIELKAGRNEIKLTKLSALLDPATIQVSGSGFTILSVRHEKDFLKTADKPQKIDILEKQKRSIQDSIKRIDLSLSMIQKELELLDRNRGIVGSTGINNEDFQEAISYFTERYQELGKSQFKLKLDKSKLAYEVTVLDRQINSISGQKEEASSNILLTLNSTQAMETDIAIQYAIKEAGWFPAYDIRANDTNSPVSLTYKAKVFQNSGIDWKNVKLRISSGNLEANGTAPELSPYYLGGVYRPALATGPINQVSGRVVDETGQPLPQVTVLVKGTTIGTPTDADGYYSIQTPNRSTLVFRFLGYVTQEIPVTSPNHNVKLTPEVTELGEVVVTAFGVSRGTLQGRVPGVHSRGNSRSRPSKASADGSTIPLEYEQINYQTSFVYDIKIPYNIPSTGKPEMVDIKTEKLEARYEYTAAPKAREDAFLVAQIADWEKLNLLDGESNLYFRNSFVGRSLIDTNVGKDTLNISLGKDEGIVVKRQRKRDFEEKRFLSGKKREQRHFEITVMNTKSATIDITLHDQIPISVRDNIRVSVDERSGAQLDEETGLLTWKLNLKPGEKKVLQLKYTVDHPKYGGLVVN